MPELPTSNHEYKIDDRVYVPGLGVGTVTAVHSDTKEIAVRFDGSSTSYEMPAHRAIPEAFVVEPGPKVPVPAPKTGVRVIRVMEYEYVDIEKAADDMARWTTNLNVKGMRMKSTALPYDAIIWEEG